MSKQVSLREHIRELRARLLIMCTAFLLWCGIGYAIRQPATHYLLSPLKQSVYYTTPQGGFEFFMRVIMTIGFIGAVPIIVHQLLRFIEPAVNRTFSAKLIRRTLLWSSILVLAGIAFGYFIILPTTLTFFGQFGGATIHPLISANDYLNLVLGILATFAFMFQLPLLITITDHIHPISPSSLTRYRRHVIVGSLLIALILPFTYDPLTQFVMAAPVIILFELAVIAVRWHHRLTRTERKDLRISHLVEAMHEAEKSVAPAPAVELMLVTELPAVIQQPTAPRPAALVAPRRVNSRPQILDLRNIAN